jgi:uncharacterized protein (TIGR02145 family)
MKRILTTVVVVTAFFIACKKDKPKSMPTVTTAAITNVTTSGATAGGTITSDGNDGISAAGIVWSKTNNTPTTGDSVKVTTTTSGSYTVNLSGLDFNTTYYIRAYATNSVGTSYGSVVTLNTTNDTSKIRFTYNGATVTYGIIISPTTGKKWMDRNLGASQVATAYNDVQAYGDLFQWGRLADGHQLRTSSTTTTTSSTDVPGNNKFIISISDPNNDWRNPENDNLWQGSTGVNNPCPAGWHVPTRTEWQAETAIIDYNTGFNILKITVGGYRYLDGNMSSSVGVTGYYWTSTPLAVGGIGYARSANISGSGFSTPGSSRGNAEAIRCIKD